MVLVSLVFSVVQAQFISPAPVLDGVISANEYGDHSNGQNQQISGTATWYMTWDASNVYLAITNTDPWEAGILYFDVNPVIPVNGGALSDGSLSWSQDYDRTRLIQPVRSDFKLYFKDSYNEFRYSDGSDSWGSAFQNTIASSANYFTNTIEIVIPWNSITNNNGRPESFNWFGYKMYDNGDGDNGTYSPVPAWNPTAPNNALSGQLNEVYVPFYYSVLNTDNTTSTKAFSSPSFTYHEDNSAQYTGGYQLGGITLHDLTINDNSSDNLDNSPSNDWYNNAQISNRVLVYDDITITNNLYIGKGSSLLPADNVTVPVEVNITMSGDSAKIYNYGRLDCTPEVTQNSGDWNLRRMNFIIDGNAEIQPSTIAADRFRFSNITISNGASLKASDTGVAEMEFQFGTLDNNGTLDLSPSSSSYIIVGLRGDNVQHNDYYLQTSNGTGNFIFHSIKIGRYSSKLQPAFNGGSMLLQIKGNFENYSEFEAVNGTGIFSIMMNGTGRQEIRGNSIETLNARTTFRNLTIANDNGNGDDNNGADVHFISTGSTTVDYYVTGVFNMTSGDLVTRDRDDPSIVHNLYLDDGVFAVGPGAQSFDGSNTSCFIDGPVSYILLNRPSSTLEFLIGKEASFRRTLFTCFNASTTDPIIYTGELFSESAYVLNNTLPSSPELISNISTVHYWSVDVNDASYFNSGFIWLDYDVIDANDGVTDPGNLRILKAPEGGNSAWENISVGVGGVGVGTGSILSNQFFSLSNFTLANVGANPLPVELIEFEAVAKGKEVHLNWSTASELNNDYFEIYKSKDGSTFEKVDWIDGAGNSNTIIEYESIDQSPFTGWSYYKLVQTDFDGTFWESELQSVFIASLDEPLIYPNPFSDFVTISTQDYGSYILYNAIGEIVAKGVLEMNGYQSNISLGNLLPGNYVLELHSDDNKVYRNKLIKF